MPQQFKIIVDVPRGLDEPIKTEVEGFKGPGCQQLTEGLEALAGKTVSDNITDEYYEQPLEQNYEIQGYN